jgi:protein arginine kinase activator
MVCQICQRKEALYHIPKIINNEIVYIHLCNICANKNNFHEIPNGLDDKLNSLLEGLLKSGQRDDRGSLPGLKCSVCKTTLKDFQKDKILGCSHCYEVFSDYLLKKSDKKYTVYTRQHLLADLPKKLDLYKKELKKAVEREDFEKAAVLRDKINTCENEGFFCDD